MPTGFVTDPLLATHDTGPGHPERPARLDAVLRAVQGLDLLPIPARDATRAELSTVHDEAYLRQVEARILRGEARLDPDTAVCPASHAAARRAAGAALALGEAFLEGRVTGGFGGVRPPGHHACRARAMGFCIFNNAALLARLLHDHGRRVAIVDWDVHHGNGTQEIFWEEPAVGYLSLHQSPLWPGTGARHETGAGNIRNIPMRPGGGDAEYGTAFRDEVLPWLIDRAPDVVVLSAGFDAHAADPLAQMRLSAEAFATFTRLLARWPLLSLLEGGYDLDALEESVRAHVGAMAGG